MSTISSFLPVTTRPTVTLDFPNMSYLISKSLKKYRAKKKQLNFSAKVTTKHKNYLYHSCLTESKLAFRLLLFFLKPWSHTNLLKKGIFYHNMLIHGPPASIRMSISKIQMFFCTFHSSYENDIRKTYYL